MGTVRELAPGRLVKSVTNVSTLEDMVSERYRWSRAPLDKSKERVALM